MTLRDAYHQRARVIVGGKPWEVSWISPGGGRVHLSREVAIRPFYRRFRYHAGGRRRITIERPADDPATIVT